MKQTALLLLFVLLQACQDNPAPSHMLLNEEHGGGGAAWGLADCMACHSLNQIHQSQHNIRPIVRSKGADTCSGCHGSNGSKQPRRCLICHNDTDLPQQPMQSGQHRHDFKGNTDTEARDSQCIICHQASDMNGHFDINRDLTAYADASGSKTAYGSQSDFCLRCHNRDHQQDGFAIAGKDFDDPLVAIEDSYRHVDKHGEVDGSGEGSYRGLRQNYNYGSRLPCSDCHAMHGTNNIKLIIDRSDKGAGKLDGTFRQQAYEVRIAGDDYSQLCVLCHEMEVPQNQSDLDTGNGLAGVHLTATACIQCHRHGEAIQAGL